MTIDEYRIGLSQLSDDQFQAFRQRLGGAEESVEQRVQAFAYEPEPERSERIIVFRLRQLGVQGLRTEAEKILDIAGESAEAAKAAAGAALQSAQRASDSVRLAGRALVVTVVAAAAAVVGVLVQIYLNYS